MKKILRYLIERITRFLMRVNIFFYFIFRGSLIRKCLHATNIKYIKVGKNVTIDEYARLDCYLTDKNIPNFVIGDGTMIGFNCTFLCTTDLIIGHNVLIASNCFITTEDHGINPELNQKYLAQPLISKSVIIEDNCWLGEKVIVCKGVKIGKFSIVGAGSVVTKDIPPYSIAVGNPAKVIKFYDFKVHDWVAKVRES